MTHQPDVLDQIAIMQGEDIDLDHVSFARSFGEEGDEYVRVNHPNLAMRRWESIGANALTGEVFVIIKEEE